MKKKIKYTDKPLGDLRIAKDFLPSPEELNFKDDAALNRSIKRGLKDAKAGRGRFVGKRLARPRGDGKIPPLHLPKTKHREVTIVLRLNLRGFRWVSFSLSTA